MVIYESLFYGCPILCSGKTPWSRLTDFNAGWNFDIDEQKGFVNCIKNLSEYDNSEHKKFIN
ncbi:MAG: hypothetical protein KKD86_15680 [Bacteroidetes bacterium]|nr:hypothetical protein [Bacteroidota bacterium]MBU1680264.1 hypothetical protein [Bacteroidota bacterium]